MENSQQKNYKILSNIPGYNRFARPILNLLLNSFDFDYKQYGLITNKNHDFIKETNYKKAINAFDKQSNYQPFHWEIHVNLWAANHAKQLDGDFVECGVYLGSNALTIAEYLDFKKLKNKNFYLFDTFCGLAKEYSSREEYDSYNGEYPDTYEYVKDTFSAYPNFKLIKGAIPETLTIPKIKKVAYLSIDMNCVLPEIEALKYFWPKMLKGGIIVLDDYGWAGHEKQKDAEDKFAAEVGTKILSLPTGQGLMIKP